MTTEEHNIKTMTDWVNLATEKNTKAAMMITVDDKGYAEAIIHPMANKEIMIEILKMILSQLDPQPGQKKPETYTYQYLHHQSPFPKNKEKQCSG